MGLYLELLCKHTLLTHSRYISITHLLLFGNEGARNIRDRLLYLQGQKYTCSRLHYETVLWIQRKTGCTDDSAIYNVFKIHININTHTPSVSSLTDGTKIAPLWRWK